MPYNLSGMLEAQRCNESIVNAKKYLQEKKNFDVSKLGELKRFRKKLNINNDGLLTYNRKIVVTKESIRSVS